MNRVCNTAVPTPPPPPAPPPPPCYSPATMCEVVGMTAADNAGYLVVTAFGKVFSVGYADNDGDMSGAPLNAPIVGMTARVGSNGYWLVASDGGIFAFDAPFLGSPA